MSSGQLKCQECDQEFTLYKNLIRHVNTVHGNESRKDNEARKDRLLECTDIHTFEETGVGCDPQVAFKSPKEYVAMAMKINHHKQLTSDDPSVFLSVCLSVCVHDNSKRGLSLEHC